MLKRFVCLAVGSVVVLAVAGIAYGAANKIRSFTPVTANGENAAADGMAILNYASGADKTIIQLILSDFSPNTTYSWVLHSSVGDPAYSDLFTTDDKGHATFHTEMLGVDVSDSDIDLFVDLDHDTNVDDGELRAVGYQ